MTESGVRPKNLTTIIVDKSTRENLRRIGRKNQTYDELINEVVAEATRITSVLNR